MEGFPSIKSPDELRELIDSLKEGQSVKVRIKEKVDPIASIGSFYGPEQEIELEVGSGPHIYSLHTNLGDVFIKDIQNMEPLG